MKRPIKFRGRRSDNGELVYGDLIQSTYNGNPVYEIRGFKNGGFPHYTTVEDSIAQLVGYDKDGKEIYEGDIATDYAGHEYYAALWGNVTKDDTLKEATK